MTQQKQKAAKADDTHPDAVLEEVTQQKPKAAKADDTQPEDAPRDQSTEPKQDQEEEPPPQAWPATRPAASFDTQTVAATDV